MSDELGHVAEEVMAGKPDLGGSSPSVPHNRGKKKSKGKGKSKTLVVETTRVDDNESSHEDDDDGMVLDEIVEKSPDGAITFSEDGTVTQDGSDNNAPTMQVPARLSHPWYRDGNVYRLVIMLTLTLLMFVAELVVGFITNSLALVSDAFHMASDGLSLLIGLFALQMAKRQKPSMRYSYGLARAEVIGGLVNGVFLLSVSLFIMFEAIQRYIDLPIVEDPLLVVYVASAGLLINIFGMFLFIGHSGVGHGHSHGGGGHSHGKKKKKAKKHSHDGKDHDIETGHSDDAAVTPSEEGEADHDHSHGHSHGDNDTNSGGEHGHGHGHGHSHDEGAPQEKKKKRLNANLHGVFLHLLGDALGSIGAIISGLCIYFMPWHEKYYIDPSLSVIISIIIMKSAIPLIISCTQILMQSVPKGVDIAELTSEVEKIPAVKRVHDLHVWQLLNDKTIGSVHVQCRKSKKFMQTARKIKKVFHDYDIHSVTIQPEFVGTEEGDVEDQCLLPCDDECETAPLWRK
eukprot:TRINITY_DN1559_c0_g1_i4.p1 TRINITY_DN1559_c0_g1~~TRINITY_DN1559_c0_g1_i4.p1  ORF type:complete len:514 (-),score=85.30 TRINITY_DN1559_c0_g1_i4:324-1865(-)